MVEQNEDAMSVGGISEKPAPRKLSLAEKYARGCKLLEIGAVGAIPFMFLWLSGHVSPVVTLSLAVLTALLSPLLMYEAFDYSARRKVSAWLNENETS